MRGCFAVCGWIARWLVWFDHGTWFGCRVVWLVWFGVADRVVYEVRSGRGIAGFHLSYSILRGTFSVKVRRSKMTKKAKWFSLAEALESYKPAEVATAIERDGIWVVDRVISKN